MRAVVALGMLLAGMAAQVGDARAQTAQAGDARAQTAPVGGAPVGDAAGAGLPPLPGFADCMNEEAARYERALKALRGMSHSPGFEIGDTRGTGYCGSVGIVLCDRMGALAAVQACQLELAAEQDALADRVRATLPPPQALATTGDAFEQALYPRVWALAQGRSAGPDCDGDIAQRGSWCAAWQANNRLSDAVLAWQLARYLGAAQSAVAAGWAKTPPPMRPRARDDSQEGAD